MARKLNYQTIAWFYDLYKRDLLDLEPPYQRRSVWNQEYKDYFIDTVLLEYPAPAIFLFEEIHPTGTIEYRVVDGKQRLSTIFEFLENEFPVYEKAEISSLQGLFFSDFSEETNRKFWGYDFPVEYLPSNDESIINNIFNRINKNVAKLTAQELRHARFDGPFISTAEELSRKIEKIFPNNFPRIGPTSRKKMKDVELVADLLLLIENGPQGYNQVELDREFSERDLEWEKEDEVLSKFNETLNKLKNLKNASNGPLLIGSRFRNQNDFYSLFGALSEYNPKKLDNKLINKRLLDFINILEDDKLRETNIVAKKYWDNIRTAPNQTIPRKDRIRIIKAVISGDFFKDKK
jgi:hypothetical protein